MKKVIFVLALIVLFMAISVFSFAEGEKGMKHDKKAMWHKQGMMQKKIVATDDGGVVVMIGRKLVKYDEKLNLVNEVDLKIDKECKKMKEQKKGEGTSGE